MLVNLEISKIFSVQGKTAVLTGASGYLGKTMVEALLCNGARVVALGRSDRLKALEKKWINQFGKDLIQIHQVDMYDLEILSKLFDHIVATEASIDILINNAHELGAATGFNVAEGTLENATFEQWQKNWMGGIYWPFLAVQKIGSKMKTAGSGSIINISTMYAHVAPDPYLYEETNFVNPPGYSSSKAALVAFTRYVASFWGRYGIRANAILPGPFSNTEREGENSVQTEDPFLERLKQRTCLKRVGLPHELLGCLLYLASDASSYMTGQSLVVDGGWTVV